ncbi:MAG TPA: acetate--CoA ligase family protein [Candidatus Woesebacteria bacterium]|nr:acetate--CoA ligase family protein [Candidatus Woesebacteria bacterium]
MTRDLSKLFNPSSIAVVGASQFPEKVGAIALKNIILSKYSGKIYPVNPTISNVGSLKFYPTLSDLPEIPDLVVIAIPAKLVTNVLEECGLLGIKNVLIFSAGFKEAGKEGADLEKKLIEVAHHFHLNILGPNCLGFASTDPSLNVTFGQVVTNPGNIRFISQSGALAASLFDWCQSTGLGFNNLTTIGNKSIVNENDILKYWLPALTLPNNTLKPVSLYLESIADGQEFIKIIKQITPFNPVFMLKPGKSPSSVAAMRSHTGSIAGEDKVLAAALSEAGIIRCQELGDFFDLTQAFSWTSVPLGPGVAVISNAGGPAVLTADTISSLGLEMAVLSSQTREKLQESLPRMASIINPVDVLGDALAQRFGEALEIVLQEKSVDSVLILLTPQLMTQVEKTAEIIGSLSKKYPKPVICSFIGGSNTAPGQKILYHNQIPNYPYPERAVKVIASMWQWQKWRLSPLSISFPKSNLAHKLKIKEIINPALQIKLPTLDNQAASKLMEAINIPVPPSKLIQSYDEALLFSRENSFPLVLKMSAPGLLHKADIGGVITGLNSETELKTAFDKMTGSVTTLSKDFSQKIEIQIQKQISGGIEVILGIKRDPIFGPVFLFGAGGKFAEIFADSNLTLLPLNLEKAKKIVQSSKVYKLLSGFRDDPPYKLDKLYQIMLTLGHLITDYPEIREIEINPLIITHQDIWALDPKVLLK